MHPVPDNQEKKSIDFVSSYANVNNFPGDIS